MRSISIPLSKESTDKKSSGGIPAVGRSLYHHTNHESTFSELFRYYFVVNLKVLDESLEQYFSTIYGIVTGSPSFRLASRPCMMGSMSKLIPCTDPSHMPIKTTPAWGPPKLPSCSSNAILKRWNFAEVFDRRARDLVLFSCPAQVIAIHAAYTNSGHRHLLRY